MAKTAQVTDAGIVQGHESTAHERDRDSTIQSVARPRVRHAPGTRPDRLRDTTGTRLRDRPPVSCDNVGWIRSTGYPAITISSNRWLSRQSSDPYVKQARSQGYRARAAFKLIELDQRDHFFKPGQRVVDLGAAPGSWSQVAVEKTGPAGRVAALDILPMDPIDGVEFIQDDFREAGALERLEALVGERVDLVLSDMAPNISGIAVSDQARGMHLAELALEFALERLEPNGVFVVKLFQGEGFDDYVRSARSRFSTVRLRKPDASRKQSREVYLVAGSRRSG